MRIVIVIQARMGSTRLPGKVMLPLAGEPLLLRMIERVKTARTHATVVVATTSGKDDDPIRALCASNFVPCYSGDEHDLLDRHYRAALLHDADVVVKIPSDCPLIDPKVIDRVILEYVRYARAYDYVSNLHPASWPDGNDVEVMPIRVLREAWKEARRLFEREHTTPFIWEQPDRYRIGNVLWESGLDYSMSHRWTIDYEEDYRFIAAVYDALYSAERPIFGVHDILSLLHRQPDIATLNSGYVGVNWYRHHLHELRTVRPEHTRMPGSSRDFHSPFAVGNAS